MMRRLPDGSRMDFTATGRVVAGRYHTCALESSSGQPMCWGHNEQGQLGDGTTISRDDAMPADIFGGLSLRRRRHPHLRHPQQRHGLLGLRLHGQRRRARAAAAAGGRRPRRCLLQQRRSAAVAAAGERHTCALRTSGTVQCWGWNNAGRVGNGTFSGTVNVLVPTSTTLGAEFWVP
ncbi:hypothetical protein FSC37_16150 [Piscinibacter aquaticus]|uniref:Uncharacterized protein n=1 Tax=Piscinibacter aquaticus TaxID=392597 RepID=A0A5C6U1L6_9BURK|nr:hypothetical protein FSC37_16150 [Piscinibacter aquaticus]